MTSNDSLSVLCKSLEQITSPVYEQRKAAEDFLLSHEGTEGYATLLLSAIKEPSLTENIQLQAVICFKNFIRRNWKVDDVSGNAADKISENDRNMIKAEVIGVMTTCNVKIQKQFGEAVAIIGKEDFPQKWQNLMSEMISRLNSENFVVVNGILLTANSLFRRYRFEMKSEALWIEIKHVLVTFAVPLTEFFVKVFDSSSTITGPEAANVYQCLYLIVQIFYSLSYQDIPEEFEDRLDLWMSRLYQLLEVQLPNLTEASSDEPGVSELLKSEICEVVSMYATKYDEEFASFLPTFVTATWKLLTSTDLSPKYDILVTNAMYFLTCVSEKAQYKALFEEENVLKSICEQVVITNIQFRESDEELFEMNPEEYVRRDIEGSDVDTRRRAACDLVKGLCRLFEEPVSKLFAEFVNVMIDQFNANPKANWKSKDAAVFLVTNLAAKSKTEKAGTTQVRELVNVSEFFVNVVSKELFAVSSLKEFPVLRADALKYLVTFRNHLQKDVLVQCLPAISAHMKAESAVVQTYSALCLEKLLILKSKEVTSGVSTLLTAADLEAHLADIISGLCLILTTSEEENEHAMKCLMRLCCFLQQKMLPYLGQIFEVVLKKLKDIIANPKKPLFIHFLFETIAVCIKVYCGSSAENKVSTFETSLLPDFEQILMKDILELLPYMFQILTLMMEMNKGISLTISILLQKGIFVTRFKILVCLTVDLLFRLSIRK